MSDYYFGYLDGMLGREVGGETDEYLMGHIDGSEARRRLSEEDGVAA